jgi:hypothetical protein
VDQHTASRQEAFGDQPATISSTHVQLERWCRPGRGIPTFRIPNPSVGSPSRSRCGVTEGGATPGPPGHSSDPVRVARTVRDTGRPDSPVGAGVSASTRIRTHGRPRVAASIASPPPPGVPVSRKLSGRRPVCLVAPAVNLAAGARHLLHLACSWEQEYLGVGNPKDTRAPQALFERRRGVRETGPRSLVYLIWVTTARFFTESSRGWFSRATACLGSAADLPAVAVAARHKVTPRARSWHRGACACG